MIERALGNIETYGLIPAIEAADAALKAANVKLVKLEYIRAGLVTVFLTGDVSAVKSSVDAGTAAAQRVGTVISTNVIARMADSLDKIVFDYPLDEEEETIEIDEAIEESDDLEEIVEETIVEFKEEKVNIASEEELDKLKVTELRQLVRDIDGIDMDNEEIKYGRKQELIDVILEYSKEVNIDGRI